METKTNKVIFHTNTIIDPISWEMQGISAKETGDPIGRFGTGLCYAIAILLRMDHKITIKAGAMIYEFGVKDMKFRGKEFKRVTCNGKEMSFTLEYGKDWECWQAYRELASNTIDEGGIQFIGEPMEDGTSIIIEGDGINRCYKDHDKYFLGEREPISKMPSLKVFEGDGIAYLKGVKVGEIQDSLYSYEFSNIELTEDRTIKMPNTLKWKIGYHICQSEDEEFLERYLLSPEGSFEHEIDIDQTWSREFEKVIIHLWKTQPTSLCEDWVKVLRAKNPSESFEAEEMNDSQKLDLDKAKDFLEKAGYPVTGSVHMVRNDDPMTIAFVTKGKIFLTTRAFDQGVFYLATTLLEEQSHIGGLKDFSREFQDHLLNQVLIQAKKALNISI